MNQEMPLIYLEINENDTETGVNVISFVDAPATQVMWTAFSEEKNKFEFDINIEERMVTGPIMLANTPIVRFSDVIGKYFVKFSKETLKKIMIKMAKQYSHKVNENHDSNKPVNGVYLVEIFQIGDKIESKLYPNLPDGTLMGTFYIEDEGYWNNVIKENKFKGFSLEGVFNLVENEEEIIEEVYSQIEVILFSEDDDDTKLLKIKNLLGVN